MFEFLLLIENFRTRVDFFLKLRLRILDDAPQAIQAEKKKRRKKKKESTKNKNKNKNFKRKTFKTTHRQCQLSAVVAVVAVLEVVLLVVAAVVLVVPLVVAEAVLAAPEVVVVPPVVVVVLPEEAAGAAEAVEQVARRSLSRSIVTRVFSSPEERKTCWSRATWCLA